MALRVAILGLRAPYEVEGGVELSVGELGPRLAARGCAVTVYCRRRYNRFGPGMVRGMRLIDTDTVYTRSLEAFVHTLLTTPRASLRADVVHIHAAGPALFSWLPRLLGSRSVVTIHGLDWKRDKWGPVARAVLRAGATAAARFPDRLITVGSHLRDWFRAHMGVDSTLIPNGVSPIPFEPLERAGVPGLRSKQFLLYLGRLVPEKGLDRLLTAYRESGIELPLLIVGGDTHMLEFGQRLRSAAPPGVRFTGPLFGPARDALLHHARALVQPSYLEGFPLSPLEALSAGRPVLLSDIAPHHEQLEGQEGKIGWIVEDTGWAAALRDLARAPDAALDQMGAAAAAHAAAAFSWEAAADRHLALYEGLRQGARPSS
jgi:glycosyltransferase involved in cell wall biosynthesis